MDPLLSVAAVVLALGVLIFTLSVPAERARVEKAPESPLRQLEQRKAAIHDSLRDLVFEFRTGKLSEQDYQATRSELQRELAALNAEMERLAARQAGATGERPAAVVTAVAPSGTGVAEPASGVVQCSSCGARFSQPMKFCGECGRPIGAGAS